MFMLELPSAKRNILAANSEAFSYKYVNYPALTDGASPPRGEDSFILPGNLLYTPSEKGMYSRGFLSTGSKGSPDPARSFLKCSSDLPSPPSYQLFQPCRRGCS
jgi:hypothetical protein